MGHQTVGLMGTLLSPWACLVQVQASAQFSRLHLVAFASFAWELCYEQLLTLLLSQGLQGPFQGLVSWNSQV